MFASSPFVVEPSAEPLQFRLAGSVFSGNIVGYVNTPLPPGLSLISNPLLAVENNLRTLFPLAPDGTQVYQLNGADYDVSIFDGTTGSWSNPNLELLTGDGFFVRNPSGAPFVNTFVGEVLVGTLVNPLPAGYSLQASLVPQSGTLNNTHRVSGRAGDRAYKFVPDDDGAEAWIKSVFDESQNLWVPDFEIGVGEGFMIYKEAPQDWVRIFSPNS